MNIKRFFGKNSREALSMVRKELGDDAVILSNRAMNGGNEIMAFKEEDMNALVAREETRQHRLNNDEFSNETMAHPDLMSLINKNTRAQSREIQELPTEVKAREVTKVESFIPQIDDYDAIIWCEIGARQFIECIQGYCR